jgi:hypothetical protein
VIYGSEKDKRDAWGPQTVEQKGHENHGPATATCAHFDLRLLATHTAPRHLTMYLTFTDFFGN